MKKEDHVTSKQAAEKIGISIAAANNYASSLNIPLQNRRYYLTQENIDKIISMIKWKSATKDLSHVGAEP